MPDAFLARRQRLRSSSNQQIRTAVEKVDLFKAHRDKLPRRVPVQAITEEPVIKLAPERKHLTNLIKKCFRRVPGHCRRAEDEGRTLIQTALASVAVLEVTDTELRIPLGPWSSPHRTRAIAALCDELNQTATVFPEFNLRLRYAIHPAP